MDNNSGDQSRAGEAQPAPKRWSEAEWNELRRRLDLRNYQKTAESPNAWMAKAEELFVAADVLFEALENAEQRELARIRAEMNEPPSNEPLNQIFGAQEVR